MVESRNDETSPLLATAPSETDKTPPGLMNVPTWTELQGFWELCRLHNNIGFWVVWLPTAWSISMAYRANTSISALQALLRAAEYIPLCFGIKSLAQIMTIDDILDEDVDALVERTRLRPIPRGAVSLKRAWLFFSVQALVGVFCAFSFLSKPALYVSIPVWPLYIIYPTCKRWTNLAPVPLGIMFKIGVFMGWADMVGTINWHVLVPVYIGACCWTLTYETVYQHQDKLDDVKIGLHSPALFVGAHTLFVCTITALLFLSLVSYGAFLNGHSWAFFSAMSIAAFLLLNRLWKTDIDVPADCKRLFLDTTLIGNIILLGFVVDSLFYRVSQGLEI
ncbi:unnamed protein product [Mycena citricolor]|uniref:UbiA prenyltransferase n=1 Tax=Mycena citricolor TaxID=2018698 RepID=A0AAD2HK94_9AGAR|nr:unnamed protein product [Mycena citricolor]